MRKHYTASFKAQVVLELLKEEKTIAQISSEYGVHVTMLHRWKNTAVENLSSVFEDESKKNTAAIQKEHEKETSELYAKIGRLTTEVEWLKKKIWHQTELELKELPWSSTTVTRSAFLGRRICSASIGRAFTTDLQTSQKKSFASAVASTRYTRSGQSQEAAT